MRSGNYISIGRVAAMLGVCTKTLRRWDAAGKFLASFRTKGGHRRYHVKDILSFSQASARICYEKRGASEQKLCMDRAAVHGRVSASRQRKSGDLERQLQALERFCMGKGYEVVESCSDVGSGLNDTRKGLLKLLRKVPLGLFDVIVVNYSDRLARFGLQIFREFVASWGVRLEVINPTIVDSSPHAELITDLTSILYSFMGKLYRLRRN